MTGPTDTVAPRTPAPDKRVRRAADDYAVASFVTGLTGLLVFNLFLGPCALIFGTLALTRGTSRRGRAWLGIALGVADLVVLAVLTAANGTLSWSTTG
ncbi:hypothetical protein DSC45_04305 [Streptomyces sp. YIM 130001]|uniref:DUF4190 domain-containing protein n=1 Tax=Streptomyces sp. YIM 130001 TaxID=2259644 RepID=UPI000E64F10E|nr:DUF4190 domain-containing protein [Streptomyces sp. YIM 130001]RII20427.1 hypothetical protein DSC45_04305 [Streptomyces sp. YIM 130001]